MINDHIPRVRTNFKGIVGDWLIEFSTQYVKEYELDEAFMIVEEVQIIFWEKHTLLVRCATSLNNFGDDVFLAIP